ncbi:MAG: hypothetical protein IPM82_25795 [Saprospiraceae bacterium]|nr:hypothetical protein [Saprospiraceae bacterium]
MQNRAKPEKGLEWADRAVTMNKSFNTLVTKAGLLKQLGKTAEADKVKAEAMTMGTEAELNLYGYQLSNQGPHDDAIYIMKLNTERHPESANAWDSLGEIYVERRQGKCHQALQKVAEPEPTGSDEAQFYQVSEAVWGEGAQQLGVRKGGW